jgi:hypothetical protein
MKYLAILAISAGLLTASQAMERPSFHTKGRPIGKPTGAKQNPKRDKYDESPIGFCRDDCDDFFLEG